MVKKDAGVRLVIWIPHYEVWMKEMLDHRVKCSEACGTISSESAEARKIFRKELREDFAILFGEEPPENEDGRDAVKKLNEKTKKCHTKKDEMIVKFREKDRWLYDEVQSRVTSKMAMGVNTTIEFEMARVLEDSLFKNKSDFEEFAEERGL